MRYGLYVTGNLVNRCIINCIGTCCTRNPQMKLKLYGRRMCSKQPYCVDHCRCGPQARPSTSFVDRLNVAKFSKSSSFGQVRHNEVLLFLRNQNVLITKTVGSFRAKNQLHSSSRFDTILACDGQPDRQTDGQTHDDSIHRASMASRRKNRVFPCNISTAERGDLDVLLSS